MHQQSPVPHKTTVCVHLMYRMHYNQATHVYVRHDAVKSLLQRPYNSPFLVIQRNDKFFTHNKNGCRDAVSIDRLKPAFLEKMDDPPLKPTTHPMTPVPPETIEPLPTVLPTPSLTTRRVFCAKTLFSPFMECKIYLLS